jgi:threonine synthase
MQKRILVCPACETEYGFGLRFDPCSSCGGPLEVRFDLKKAFDAVDGQEFKNARGSIWRFWPFFPISDPSARITLGEGGTPLLRHERLNELLGLPNLLIKNESANPTWSFKDRLNSINVTMAREFRINEIVASSTGNHGASAAAYAGAAGMRSLVLLPHGTPDVFSQMIYSYGGTPVLTDWHGRYPLMEHLVGKGWYPSKSALPAPLTNPFGLEGYKSIAYELAIECPEGIDHVVVPVGSGDDLAGIYKGFAEFKALGLTDRLPSIVSAEAESAAPTAAAIRAGADKIVQVGNPRTIATSISEGIASNHVLRAVRGSGGFSSVASESEIFDAMKLMAAVGFAAESSSCVALAALINAVRDRKISASSRVVIILTSAGVKWQGQLARIGGHAVSIRPDPAQLEEVLRDRDAPRPLAQAV